MAALKHNGTEVARIVALMHPDEDGDVWERQYSVRSNGWVLVQSVRRPADRERYRPHRTGWTRFAKWAGNPDSVVRIISLAATNHPDAADAYVAGGGR
jgi:hypothetical protein